jgi:ABC-2 type transport system permease protein
MTSATIDHARPSTVAGAVTQARVIRSEWTKFRSLRSTWWTIGTGVALTVGIGVLISLAAAAEARSSSTPVDVAARSEVGNIFAQLALGVLAVLLMSGEHGTGMIRSSMTAVPRRLPVLWGKLVVYVLAILPIAAIASAAAFLLGQAVWRGKGRTAIGFGDDNVARIVLGAALYLSVAGVIALAIGTLLRSTAAGITVVVGLFFVLPTAVQALPERIAAWGRFLPSNAGGALWHQAISAKVMAPWSGFALLCAYAVVLVAAAAWTVRRRDV